MPASSQPTEPASTAKRDRQHSLAALIADGDKVVAERFRTKLCRNFATKGSCPYESRCMFAHGRRQLRTKQMNLRDGLVSEEAIRQFKRAGVPKSQQSADAHTPPAQADGGVLLNNEDSDDFVMPGSRDSTPLSARAEHQLATADSGSELNSSIVPDLEESEARTSPELTLSSLCWFRRNPYDFNNTIILSPSAASSRASATDPAE